MPLTPDTEGIVGEAELRALPQRACLLNPVCGALIDQSAMVRALQQGWISGAALDTHHQTPLPKYHATWGMPNVIITSHISGTFESPYTLYRIWDIFVQNVERFASQQSLINEIPARDLNAES